MQFHYFFYYVFLENLIQWQKMDQIFEKHYFLLFHIVLYIKHQLDEGKRKLNDIKL